MLKSIHSELGAALENLSQIVETTMDIPLHETCSICTDYHPKAKSTVPNHDENANKSIVTRTSDSDFPLSQRNEQSNKEDDGILA